ncbi:MAG: hypothetical protein ACE5GN_05550, partial [Waddliaceae bacterium]
AKTPNSKKSEKVLASLIKVYLRDSVELTRINKERLKPESNFTPNRAFQKNIGSKDTWFQ